MNYKTILLNLIENLQNIAHQQRAAFEKTSQADITIGSSFYHDLDDAIADAFGLPQENIPDFDPTIPFDDQWSDSVHFCRDAITTAFVRGTSADVLEAIEQLLEESAKTSLDTATAAS